MKASISNLPTSDVGRQPAWLDRLAAAKLANVRLGTLYALIHRHEIDGCYVLGQLVVSRKSIERYQRRRARGRAA